ncbi:amino acid adenylation domain-containing protein [Nonomuraea sp. MG754425]|uniref:non-ribosomal peptide synthetase n=1 Tax=Nonomuraea sp. MG754425 TaxID=2570319 RepID=UPI001F182422|nr:amino acid adenylation domain-containing protein [Nonomuraea sp. MG754425]MCF6473391.1 amino acid adenylation domain-containing protein [Nonomuraea sp. MG754425]
MTVREPHDVSGDGHVVVPASAIQQQFWFAEHLAPATAQNNMALRFWLRGQASEDGLERALAAVVADAAALRTSLEARDQGLVQLVHARCVLPLERVEAGSRAKALEIANRLIREPIVPTAAPAARAALIRAGHGLSCLVFVVHHAFADQVSLGILQQRISAYYCGLREADPSRPVLSPFQYADYALLEAGRQAERSADEFFWAGELSGYAQVLDLPADRPRPARWSPEGATHRFHIPAERARAFHELARSMGTTPFMAHLSLFAVLLGQWSGQESMLIGSPVSLRTDERFRDVVGPLINTVVFGMDLSAAPSFDTLLRRTRITVLRALGHRDYPFVSLVDLLAPRRDPSRSPLVQVAFTLYDDGQTLRLPGVEVRRLESDTSTAKLDLLLQVTPTADGFSCSFEYSAALFEPSTIALLADWYGRLLEGVTAEPGRPLAEIGEATRLSAAERRVLLEEWCGTAAGDDGPSAPELIVEAATRSPRDRALIDRYGEMAYHELVGRALALARRLRPLLRQGPDNVVGLCLPRDRRLVVAMIAVHWAGAAYLPLDPELPAARLQSLADDARIAALLTTRDLRTLLDAGAAPVLTLAVDHDLAPLPGGTVQSLPTPRPTDGAYLLYTSGSTGRPKGVLVEHRNLVNVIESFRREPGFTAADRFLAATSVGFDIAALELLLPLCCGGTVVLADSARSGAEQLLEVCRRHGVTVLQATPSILLRLVRSGAMPLPRLRQIWCGGEALSASVTREILAWCSGLSGERRPAVYNVYGPTETTIWSTMSRVDDDQDDAPTIGRPIFNTTVYVVDEQFRLLPVGAKGELVIGGAGVARGYWRSPDLTRERFRPDPFGRGGDDRLYRTGDLVRWRRDGNLEFLGRLDDQVKVHGFRIEPEGVAVAVRDLPQVRDAVVMARHDMGEEPVLVAYVVAAQGVRLDPGACRSALAGRLPTAMVPAHFVQMDGLPLSPNGKVDRRALWAPHRRSQGEAVSREVSATERMLCEVWAEVLGLESVSPLDDFFMLGGNSLEALGLLDRVQRITGLEIALDKLFSLPELSAFAAYLDELGEATDARTRAAEFGR